jgi:GAF domain-containing protein/signal transduction histidine kinase
MLFAWYPEARLCPSAIIAGVEKTVAAGQTERRLDVIKLAIELANDLVAFDRHLVLLEMDRGREEPQATWHYSSGPLYAGSRFDRDVRVMREAWRRLKSSRSSQEYGFCWRGRRAYVVKIPYYGSTRGYILVERDGPGQEFSVADVLLLSSVAFLAGTAMSNAADRGLLEDLHVRFLDKRVAAYQAETPTDVAQMYVDKTASFLMPHQLWPDRMMSDKTIEMCHTIKLATPNGTALRIVAGLWATIRGGRQVKYEVFEKPHVRYEADGKSSITARVFASQCPYHTNRYQLLKEPVRRLVRRLRSHISAPIVAGKDHCYGVLSIETTGEFGFSPVHKHLVALLAAHAARPLGRATDRTLAGGRKADLAATRAIMEKILACQSWTQIQSAICRGLPTLQYHRGLICEVQYDRGLVVGTMSWGPKMRKLCEETIRHFVRNKNDVQIRAVMTGKPQPISNPQKNRAAHRRAVRTATLEPFVVIPVANPSGKTTWTLHVERQDTAPIGNLEIEDLQELCRVAAIARSRIEVAEEQRRIADATVTWGQGLQEGIPRERVILQSLCDFVVKHGCSRARLARLEQGKLVGLCYAGPRMRKPSEFLNRRYQLGSPNLLSTLSRSNRPLVVRASRTRRQREHQGEFGIEYVTSLPPFLRSTRRENRLVEWVLLPLGVRGRVFYVLEVDRLAETRHSHDGHFLVEELRWLTTLGRLTSLTLERAALMYDLVQYASVGTLARAFRHQIERCLQRIANLAVVCRSSTDDPNTRIDELTRTVAREVSRVSSLREFFTEEVMRESDDEALDTTVSKEVDLAVNLLGLEDGDLVPRRRRLPSLRVPCRRHPLCLIVMHLVDNARNAMDNANLGYIEVRCGRRQDGPGYVLGVCDNGRGIPDDIAAAIRKGDPVYKGKRLAEGLRSAELIAKEQGWDLRLSRARKPTRFELFFPDNV